MPSLPILVKIGNRSSKTMAATVARTVQVVRPHIPLIKFPTRGPQAAGQGAAQSFGKPGNVESLISSTMGSTAAASKPSASVSKGPAIESSELPPRYRRKQLSQEEIEFIEKGGQV
ncbi:28S ribosomal protein S36, mitochondrial isoform X2 [Aplysia californica]|uniref:28S ribosomal protein S36, mitochondrial isoform X2 n=1 Tax=Aplysia californica TaxID=6500 RepID=A0ABM0JIF7_APLCA|nr:28S ribosomal protein S36, mitochondrial isoform X2 [Aplysia californica]